MLGSLVVYLALTTLFVGVALCFARRTRKRGVVSSAIAVVLAGVGLVSPAPERHVEVATTRLDELMPRWRLIYPGSSLIRYMWLRAIEHRALTPANRPT